MTQTFTSTSARGSCFKSLGRVFSGSVVLGFAALLTGCGGGGTVACSAGLGFLVSSAACKVNYAPVANAGPLQNVNVGKPVRLDGSLSRDKNNSSLTYKWTLACVSLFATSKTQPIWLVSGAYKPWPSRYAVNRARTWGPSLFLRAKSCTLSCKKAASTCV